MKKFRVIAKRNGATLEQIVTEKELATTLKKLKAADFTVVSSDSINELFDNIDKVGSICDNF